MFDFNVARTPQNTEYLGIAYTEGEKSAQRGQLLELINLLIGETSVRVTSEAIVKLPTLDIGIDHRKPQQADINKKRVMCHAGGGKDDPECWDGWEETFDEGKCPYFVSFWGDILPVVRRLIKDGED